MPFHEELDDILDALDAAATGTTGSWTENGIDSREQPEQRENTSRIADGCHKLWNPHARDADLWVPSSVASSNVGIGLESTRHAAMLGFRASCRELIDSVTSPTIVVPLSSLDTWIMGRKLIEQRVSDPDGRRWDDPLIPWRFVDQVDQCFVEEVSLSQPTTFTSSHIGGEDLHSSAIGDHAVAAASPHGSSPQGARGGKGRAGNGRITGGEPTISPSELKRVSRKFGKLAHRAHKLLRKKLVSGAGGGASGRAQSVVVAFIRRTPTDTTAARYSLGGGAQEKDLAKRRLTGSRGKEEADDEFDCDDGRTQVELKWGKHTSVRLSAAHYEKLRHMYNRRHGLDSSCASASFSGAREPIHGVFSTRTEGKKSKASGGGRMSHHALKMQAVDDEHKFHERLLCMLLRYDSFGESFEYSLDGKVSAVLHQHLGVSFECFASPLNARYGRFCSPFPDTDAFFGSVGSFFSSRDTRGVAAGGGGGGGGGGGVFNPSEGSFVCHPPHVASVVRAMAGKLHSLLLPLTHSGGCSSSDAALPSDADNEEGKEDEDDDALAGAAAPPSASQCARVPFGANQVKVDSEASPSGSGDENSEIDPEEDESDDKSDGDEAEDEDEEEEEEEDGDDDDDDDDDGDQEEGGGGGGGGGQGVHPMKPAAGASSSSSSSSSSPSPPRCLSFVVFVPSSLCLSSSSSSSSSASSHPSAPSAQAWQSLVEPGRLGKYLRRAEVLPRHEHGFLSGRQHQLVASRKTNSSKNKSRGGPRSGYIQGSPLFQEEGFRRRCKRSAALEGNLEEGDDDVEGGPPGGGDQVTGTKEDDSCTNSGDDCMSWVRGSGGECCPSRIALELSVQAGSTMALFYQTDSGAQRWPVTDQAVDDLRAAFQDPWRTRVSRKDTGEVRLQRRENSKHGKAFQGAGNKVKRSREDGTRGGEKRRLEVQGKRRRGEEEEGNQEGGQHDESGTTTKKQKKKKKQQKVVAAVEGSLAGASVSAQSPSLLIPTAKAETTATHTPFRRDDGGTGKTPPPPSKSGKKNAKRTKRKHRAFLQKPSR